MASSIMFTNTIGSPRPLVVGEASIAQNQLHAFLHSGNKMTDLGTLPDCIGGSARGINASGKVVGYCPLHTKYMLAFLYVDGMMTNLGYGWAADINDSDQTIFNRVDIPYYGYHAYLYYKGNVTNLGTLSGAQLSSSNGSAINNLGQVVGYSEIDASRKEHAFLYSERKLTDLGVLSGDSESRASDINDSGQVVGSSIGSKGSPEPSCTRGTRCLT